MRRFRMISEKGVPLSVGSEWNKDEVIGNIGNFTVADAVAKNPDWWEEIPEENATLEDTLNDFYKKTGDIITWEIDHNSIVGWSPDFKILFFGYIWGVNKIEMVVYSEQSPDKKIARFKQKQ